MATEITRRRFTVDDYHKLAETGILAEDDRVELVGGEIIQMSAMGAKHASCLHRADRKLQRSVPDDEIVRAQLPVIIPHYDEPEPDLAVVRARGDDYRLAHPSPEDTLLVIEIADSSLSFDRNIKLPLYAAAGIPEAWLFDLNGEGIERHTDPVDGTYRLVARAGRGRQLESTALPGLVLVVDEVLGGVIPDGERSARAQP